MPGGKWGGPWGEQWGSTGLSGSYETAIVDLGSIQNVRCSFKIVYLGIDLESLFDSITNFDSIDSFDNIGITTKGITVRPQIAISQDGTNWSAWRDLFVADIAGRAFKFKLDVGVDSDKKNVEISDLEFYVDMPDRIEEGQDVVIAASPATDISYIKTYKKKPIIGITIQSASLGDYYVLTNQSVTGFTIQIKDSGGNGVQRTIDYEARGY